MRRRFILCLLLIGISHLYGQSPVDVLREHGSRGGKRPIPGSLLLAKQDQEVCDLLQVRPDLHPRNRVSRSHAWNFTVGTTRVWLAADFTTNANYSVPSTCRAVGSHCYIFVEDAAWGTRVNQSAVDSIVAGFDLRTPARGDRGIYQTDVDAFGNPPDVDGDPRIVILILDIKDGFNGSGGYVAGYFSSKNEVGDNLAEIQYIDANPADLQSSSDLNDVLGTTAHEFQHMIHFGYDPSEATFVNEMCSLTAEVFCGYPPYDESLYNNETNRYLLDWRSYDMAAVLSDYSRASRFGRYLLDQFGIGLFKSIVSTTSRDITGLNDSFAKFGTPLRLSEIFANWTVANILRDTSVRREWGYADPAVVSPLGSIHYNPNYSTTDGSSPIIRKLSVAYHRYPNIDSLRANVTLSGTGMFIKGIIVGGSSNQVIDLTSTVEHAFSPERSKNSDVVVAVINSNTSLSVPYSLKSTGRMTKPYVELKWDEAEPVRELNLAAGDTMCVAFTGVPGAHLDSLRLALRREGSLSGSIYQYTGSVRPRPLGAMLTQPFEVISTSTPSEPFPVPYPNWVTVDLRSRNIDAGNSFAAAFPVTESGKPNLLVSEYPGQSAHYSYTYISDIAQPDWYYFVSGASAVWIYDVRAYVSFNTSTDVHTVELSPITFSMSKNYPNPFNPATHIQYSIPARDRTVVSVYDLLGRLVATVVDEIQERGSHEVTWNAAGCPSGTYVCVLTQGSGRAITKLLLVK